MASPVNESDIETAILALGHLLSAVRAIHQLPQEPDWETIYDEMNISAKIVNDGDGEDIDDEIHITVARDYQ